MVADGDAAHLSCVWTMPISKQALISESACAVRYIGY
jgi:hypothetical protein